MPFRQHSLRLCTTVFAVSLSVVVLGAFAVRAEQGDTRSDQDKDAYHRAMLEADQQIQAAENGHSEAMQNEEYLTTYIGPRLTGTPAQQKATQWALDRFRQYGLDAHLETGQIPHAWYRGNDWGELLTPVDHWMTVHSAAWSKATPGPISGRLVSIDENAKPEDISSNSAKYKGVIVLAASWPPCSLELSQNPPNAFDAGITPPIRQLLRASLQGGPQAAAIMQRSENLEKVMAALAPAGAAAILRDSCMPDAMLLMGDAGNGTYEQSAIPVAYISHPDYEWLERLAKSGQGTFQLDLQGKFSPGPVPVSDVVAQIKGSEHPEEQVIIGGHLDSWDLAEGAVDNGTGAIAVLEAARLLKSLNWAPKRTLTFVLFYGEEQDEGGSNAFVEKHAAEIDKVDAVLIDDLGAGRISSIPLGDLWPTGVLLGEIYRPLSEVFDLEPISNGVFSGSDHDSFLSAGVPAYIALQEAAHYGYAHHSTDDVFELVEPDALRQQAAVLAAWMWNVSQMPPSLPHHPKSSGS